MSVLNDLVHADKGCCTVVRGDLDFVVPDIDEALDCFKFAVAVFDCSAWWSITVVVSVRHFADCALWHDCNLCSGVHDCGYIPDMLRIFVLALELERLCR